MRAKSFIFLAALFLSAPTVLAESTDLWDNFGDVNFYTPPEQTAVSDEQFDKTVEKVQENKKKKWFSGEPKTKKMKGESYQESNETDVISGIKTDTPVLTIPCELKALNGEVVPIGHYQAVFEKDSDGFVTMKLYQSHFMVAQFPAEETEEDLFDDHINYLTLEDFKDNKVKINYGSMDFNAFAIIEKKAP